MATSPSPAAGGPPPQGGASPAAGSPPPTNPAMQLAYLGQMIQSFAQKFPQGAQGFKTMLDGLRQVQSSISAQSSPQQPAAPPR